ncbi:sulfite exporter TauE/SafE family protein [Pengzhenrongella sp.]|uniref:sulfite exporter TauE/SafE family protein n=1 Tax=Pengzhenrongella sp. TaxID=2888820 RepID=UPI002F94CFAD
MPALSPVDLTLLALAASLVGLSKTALPGAATLTVAVFAAVLPAKQSTGALLVLLILGDLFAVWTYHAHADWKTLRRMVPAVLVGVLVGTGFLATAGDAMVRRVIGVILLVLVAVTLLRRAAATRTAKRSGLGTLDAGEGSDAHVLAPPASPATSGRGWRRRLETGTYGLLAGFTTMVANSGGPVMSMYFLATRYSINRFLGTAAWFFFVVNLTKTPFSISLGLISLDSLKLDLLLAPAVVVGAIIGRRLAKRIDQVLFDRLVLALTVVSASYLLLQ